MSTKKEQWIECLKTTGSRIKLARKAKNMTIEALSHDSGISRDECKRIETGNDWDPSLRSMIAIAHVLGQPLDSLLPDQWPQLGAEH